MTPIYDQAWFKKTVDSLRRWKWFDKYIYGRSINYEDFMRNPAEVLMQEVPPFCVKDVKPITLVLIRLGFKAPGEWPSWDLDTVLGKGLRFTTGSWKHYLGVMVPWVTKFPNNVFALNITVSMKGWLPLPLVTLQVKPTAERYFQAGIGWGPEIRPYGYDGVFWVKCRIGSYAKEKEWNPGSEIYGFADGTC